MGGAPPTRRIEQACALPDLGTRNGSTSTLSRRRFCRAWRVGRQPLIFPEKLYLSCHSDHSTIQGIERASEKHIAVDQDGFVLKRGCELTPVD
jgi:hypothetical protein